MCCVATEDISSVATEDISSVATEDISSVATEDISSEVPGKPCVKECPESEVPGNSD